MREICHIQEDAFSIRADLDQRLLDIKLKGYWDLATVEHFARCAERAAMALRRAGCPPGEQLTLVDNRALSIQSQDVVKRFDALIETRLNRSHRTAVVVASPLLRMQAKRVGPDHRFFEDRESALGWLCTPAD